MVIVEDQQGLVAASSLISAVTSPWNDDGTGGPSSGATRSPVPGGPGRARPPRAAEPGRVVVPRVQREPSRRRPAAPCPVRQQDGLAISGGAQTSTSPCPRPSSSRAVSRGRGTRSGRGAGICSLVASRTWSTPGLVETRFSPDALVWVAVVFHGTAAWRNHGLIIFPLLFYRTSVQLRCPVAPPGGAGSARQAPRRGVGISSSGTRFAPRVPGLGKG